MKNRKQCILRKPNKPPKMAPSTNFAIKGRDFSALASMPKNLTQVPKLGQIILLDSLKLNISGIFEQFLMSLWYTMHSYNLYIYMNILFSNLRANEKLENFKDLLIRMDNLDHHAPPLASSSKFQRLQVVDRHIYILNNMVEQNEAKSQSMSAWKGIFPLQIFHC